ncbi:MAG TPA: type VI secretion system baseplate subunit TssK [Gemmatimonadales bacterium]|nr:type VI secretion system baseplate subunit TssK [Gemmatimonadales bacterium]
MTALTRVVWQEGMHLAQHHFQLQGKYFEDSLRFAVEHLFYRPYGYAGLELDAEALRNGTVAVVHARGVLPDGLAFHIPEGDPAPKPLEIRELFSPTADSHLVHLVIPPYRPGQPNCAVEGDLEGATRRYIAENSFIRDETTGRDEQEVSLGRKNFTLALDPPEGTVSMPLGRIRRDGTGNFMYDPAYVPPCLQIGASSQLMALVARMVEMLDQKSDAMLQDRRADRKGVAEYAAHEVASFWLAHTIHASLGPLRYHRDTRAAHPEQLYIELARLGGALCTFALDAHPRTVPGYDHDRLGDCFLALERHIRAHLEVILPSSYLAVPLAKQADYLYAAPVNDQRAFGPSRWFLGVRCAMGESEIISRVPSLVKICSQKHILRLVKEAYAGLSLEHVPSAPAGIAPRVDTQYFLISRSGPCWEAIQKTKEIGIYVPEIFRNVELDLRIMMQGQG